MKRRAESLSPPPPPINGGDLHAEKEQVMSEVHLGCPPGFSGPHISYFTISIPPGVEPIGSRYNDLIRGEADPTYQMISLDEDGDLVLTRRSERSNQNAVLTIQHNITSTIPSVGLQVWRAELILADFVLHKMLTSSEFDGIVSLELGAGTGILTICDVVYKCHQSETIDFISVSLSGLVGILLARVAKTVFLTEFNLCNPTWLTHELSFQLFLLSMNQTGAMIFLTTVVRTLSSIRDVSNIKPQFMYGNSIGKNYGPLAPSRKRYSWTSSEVEEAQGASLLIAADVIYSDDLTSALFRTLEGLMSQGSEKVLYLAVEKRYNFSLDDLNVVANGYSHFQSYLKDVVEYEDLGYGTPPYFVGKRIDLTKIPQYVKEYERGNDVEIWQIKYRNRKS